MSRRNPTSSEFKRHRVAEYRVAANGIETLLDRTARQQIDFPSEDVDEFVFHMHHIEQGPARIGRECNENIHVAVWCEIVAHHAAEKRELRHLPLAAEVAEFLLVVVDGHVESWHFRLRHCREWSNHVPR